MRIFQLFLLSLIIVLGCAKKEGVIADSVERNIPIESLSIIVDTIKTIPDPKITEFVFLHRRLSHNLFSEDVEVYINTHGVAGVLRGLCDFRELDELATFMQSSGDPSSTKIRYCDVFLYMSTTSEQRDSLLPYGITKSEINQMLADEISNVVSQIKGKKSLNGSNVELKHPNL